MTRLRSPAELTAYRQSLLAATNAAQPALAVCLGTGCQAYRASELADAISEELARRGLSDRVRLRRTGCHGFCERGPLVVVHPQGIFYPQISIDDVPEIIEETVLRGRLVERLLYVDRVTGEKYIYEGDVPFYRRQMRLALRFNGRIDPTEIDDYLAEGGYVAAAKALTEYSPGEIIDLVERSGLRGRGGAGFPTGAKWRSCHVVPNEPKYVICNGDEGDPGAFMDRSIMEASPHSVLEGMLIGAYAIGAHQGYIYVRNEYPLAVSNLRRALEQAKDYGLLGKDVLGTGFDFDIAINRGGGAFVCGESTALMASLEGRVGEPRAKHIHTTRSGLWGKPTNLNNVETWANVPVIIERGADWYAAIGTEKSKGTKVFSLVGKVNNTGLVEVPMGMTLRDIVFDIGGGVSGGKRFKAVQTGGPSGGCLPEGLLDLPVDFERLAEVGSMMGSGGMIVMDEDTCMVNVARYFVDFLRDESCGKCTSCREGIRRMYEILTDVCEGRGSPEDLDLLEELANVVAETSLCQLGGTAPNPVLTTMRWFRAEYEAHLQGKCPAKVCSALLTYSIDQSKCRGCTLCLSECPQAAITGERRAPHHITMSKCGKCGACRDVCKFDAVIVQ